MSKDANCFTHKDGDNGQGLRWITHDPDDHFAGEFRTESDAKQAVDRWNHHAGRLVKVDWTAPHDDAPDSDRGIYIITVEGSDWQWRSGGGWHSMEEAAGAAQRLRDCVAKHGAAVVVDVLNSIQA